MEKRVEGWGWRKRGLEEDWVIHVCSPPHCARPSTGRVAATDVVANDDPNK